MIVLRVNLSDPTAGSVLTTTAKHSTRINFWEIWRDIHTLEAPTQAKLDSILARLPRDGCNCWLVYSQFIVDNPPPFDDWQAWHRWTWTLHNCVNAELGKPMLAWHEFEACWLDIAPRTKSRLVITVATGPQFVALLSLTKPAIAAYAERCNADLVCLTNRKYEQWQREKFRVFEFSQQYDETLFIDADCLIRPWTIDLFDDCRGHDVGMHNDWGKLPSQWDWPAEYLTTLQSQALGADAVHLAQKGKVVWNSGVVYCTREAAAIWRPPANRLPDSHCSEQFLVHYQASKFRIKALDAKYNWQYWFNDFAEGIDEAQIVHLANHPDKLSGVAKYLTHLDRVKQPV